MFRNWPNRTVEIECASCRLRDHGTLTPQLKAGLERIRTARLGMRVLPERTRICTEGETSSEIFTLVAGWAFRYKLLRDGRRQILGFCLPGDFFGLGCDESQGHDHSIESITHVVLCAFSRAQFETVVQSDPASATFVRRIVRAEESAAFDHLVNVGRRSALEAVGHLLLELCQRQRRGRNSKNCNCGFPITQTLLADALGLSGEHVNRVLRRLRDDGLVSINNHNLFIHDVGRLAELSEFKRGSTARLPVV